MIIIVCIATGIAMRLLTGRGIASLAHAKLRGEQVLLVLLASQSVLPFFSLTGIAARLAFYAWLATFPCMIIVSWLNRREPGIPLLGLGLLLNLVVVASNGGMPVFGSALPAAQSSANTLAIPLGDFVHVAGGAATRLPWLSDIIPVPGPLLKAVASPGDLLLFAGIVAFVAAVGSARPATRISA